TVATSDSMRAVAARLVTALGAGDSRTTLGAPGNLTDSQAQDILGRAVARTPQFIPDSARCVILGHVLESADVAHVVFRLAYELPGSGIVPMPPEPQIATARLITGQWKLALDEWSDIGVPGFRNVIVWSDGDSTTGVL